MESPVSTESSGAPTASSTVDVEHSRLDWLHNRNPTVRQDPQKDGWFPDGTAFASQEDLLAGIESMLRPDEIKKSRRLVARHEREERLHSTSSRRRKWTRLGLLSLLFTIGLAITARVVPATMALDTHARTGIPIPGQIQHANHTSSAKSVSNVVAPTSVPVAAGPVNPSTNTIGGSASRATTSTGSSAVQAPPTAAPTPIPTPAPPSNLFSNPSFETDTSGWTTIGSIARSGLVAPPPGGGAYEVLVSGTQSHPQPVGISSPPIQSVTAGQRYTASGFFDMDGYLSADISLSITEYTAAGAVVDHRSSLVALSHSGSWQQATVSYTVERSGGYIVVAATNTNAYDSFLADMFSLKLG